VNWRGALYDWLGADRSHHIVQKLRVSVYQAAARLILSRGTAESGRRLRVSRCAKNVSSSLT
jgi:hypothetical protein